MKLQININYCVVKRNIILSFIFFLAFYSNLLAQKITEVAADKQILHYQKFPLSEDVDWYQLDDLLQARFMFNDKEKIVIYGERMEIIQEWTEMTFIPVEVDIHLSSEYDSPKIKAVYEVEDKQNDTSFYSVLVKVKGEGLSMHAFDKMMEATARVTMLAIVE